MDLTVLNVLPNQQSSDTFHQASSQCVLSRKWLQLTGKVWWLESYQCEETSGSTRVVQQSKLIYDIDTLSNSGMCDMWKVLFSGKLKLRRWILFFFNLFSNNTWGAYIVWQHIGIYEGQYFLQLRSLCEGQFRFKIQNLSDVRGKLTGSVLFSGRGLGKKLSIFQSRTRIWKGWKVQDV